MLTYKEDEVHVLDDSGLNELLDKYHCTNQKQLDDLLWYTYGVTLCIDYYN